MHNHRIWRCGRAVALGAVLIVASGCAGSAATPEASPAPTEAATPAPTPAPTPTPTAEPAGSVGVGGDGILCAAEGACPLSPGTYRSALFAPPFSVTVDDGWTNERDFVDGGGMTYGPGGIYWASGVSKGIVNEAEVAFDSTVDGFIEHLRSVDGFTVSDAPSRAIGGQDAVVVDVDAGQTMARGLFLLGQDAFNLVPGEKARFYVLERDGTLVVFIVDAYAGTDFDAVLARSEPILDNITWG